MGNPECPSGLAKITNSLPSFPLSMKNNDTIRTGSLIHKDLRSPKCKLDDKLEIVNIHPPSPPAHQVLVSSAFIVALALVHNEVFFRRVVSTPALM